MKQVVEVVNMSESTIRRMIEEDKFPHPVQISSRLVGFRKSDLEKWESELV